MRSKFLAAAAVALVVAVPSSWAAVSSASANISFSVTDLNKSDGVDAALVQMFFLSYSAYDTKGYPGGPPYLYDNGFFQMPDFYTSGGGYGGSASLSGGGQSISVDDETGYTQFLTNSSGMFWVTPYTSVTVNFDPAFSGVAGQGLESASLCVGAICRSFQSPGNNENFHSSWTVVNDTSDYEIVDASGAVSVLALAVPEPADALLLMVGAFCIALMQRRSPLRGGRSSQPRCC